MRIEPVEIFSDTTNMAVLRHPERKFPGSLVQGDTLYSMCKRIDSICAAARSSLDKDSYAELNHLRNALWDRLNHYKSVLTDHGIELPFDETP